MPINKIGWHCKHKSAPSQFHIFQERGKYYKLVLYYVKTIRRYFVIEHRCVNFIYQMSKYYGKQKHNLLTHFKERKGRSEKETLVSMEYTRTIVLDMKTFCIQCNIKAAYNPAKL